MYTNDIWALLVFFIEWLFSNECRSNLHLLGFAFLRSSICLILKTTLLSQPMRVEPKPTVSLPHAFSRAWRILYIFDWSFDSVSLSTLCFFVFGCDIFLVLALRESTEKRSVMNSNKESFTSIK